MIEPSLMLMRQSAMMTVMAAVMRMIHDAAAFGSNCCGIPTSIVGARYLAMLKPNSVPEANNQVASPSLVRRARH
jgi:hypothetical protein